MKSHHPVISREKPPLSTEARLHLMEIAIEAIKRRLDKIERLLSKEET